MSVEVPLCHAEKCKHSEGWTGSDSEYQSLATFLARPLDLLLDVCTLTLLHLRDCVASRKSSQ